jgi:hypothetical protein
MVSLFAWHLAGPVFCGRQVFGDGIGFAGIGRLAGRLGSVAAWHNILFCLQKVSFFDSLRERFWKEKEWQKSKKLPLPMCAVFLDTSQARVSFIGYHEHHRILFPVCGRAKPKQSGGIQDTRTVRRLPRLMGAATRSEP